ncbi:E3 ubiquitin-protein ligase RNF186 [Podarcis raffonei]|uniref:E3 ubiquitin-protein ligase RNF186 n=1 Tax=Podarcis raffonei TaxID=65483 RepID=UPI0023298783|nr:E3 ubiquitin-protein ligase RNF186 [Podarcis raffonei]
MFGEQTKPSLCVGRTKRLYKRSFEMHTCSLKGAAVLSLRPPLSPMEGSRDHLHTESETVSPGRETGQLGMAEGDAAEMDVPETSKSPIHQEDACPLDEADPTEEGKGCCSPAAEGPDPDAAQLGTPEPVPSAPLEPPALTETSVPPVADLCHPRPSKVSLAEMDCLICFNRYSACRLPKVLACQHVFCAVCLKLILRNEDHTWVVSCPLCRKATVVFGGLICSLHDKEDVVGRLGSPGLDAEVPCPPDPPGTGLAEGNPASENDANRGPSRAAAKRLVLLLLLVAVLIVLVLPFMYTGMLKWVLCSVVVLGLIMSVLLCCNPSWSCPDLLRSPWRWKERQEAPVA